MPIKEKRMDAILRILEDQKTHSVSEIASRVNISEEKVELFLRFLAKYEFVTYDEERKTAVMRADSFSF
jgi:Mn-dependent DtxR family transcriptional regulator